ncbi:hypothetical protein ACFUJ0_06150 [Streptomyces sp. NPDC057242]|uniref:hypothetical protein n=1 Tax=unclassified Streptomyces TaxID=2593676 RepID=UPI00364584B4
MNVEGLLHLLAAEPTLLPVAPTNASGEEIEARRQSGKHACLWCGQTAVMALIVKTPDHGQRWLDLCMAHFVQVRQADQPGTGWT